MRPDNMPRPHAPQHSGVQPDTDALRGLLDLDRLACGLCVAFWAHGDNNEAAMRAALTELGVPGYLAELSALRARVEGADKYMIEPLTRVSSDGETMFYGGAIHVSNNMIGQRVALVKVEG